MVEWLQENAHQLAAYEIETDPRKTTVEDKIAAAAREIAHDNHDGRRSRPRAMSPSHRKLWRRLQDLFNSERSAANAEQPDPTTRCLQSLGNAAGLTPEDVRILEALLYYETHVVFEDMIDEFTNDLNKHLRHRMSLRSPLLAIILGLSVNSLRSRLAKDALLVRHGLVSVDNDGEIELVRRLHRLASVVEDQADVRRLLFGETPATDLARTDFDHLGQSLGDVEDLLRGSLERRARGVNILFHGHPAPARPRFAACWRKASARSWSALATAMRTAPSLLAANVSTN